MLTGFIGAFTTFSTFALDTAKLIQPSQYAMAFGNVFGQTALGIPVPVAGVLIGGRTL